MKADAKSTEHKAITLEEPIQRGEGTIKEVTIRKLNTGALRGLSLADVVRMDTDSIIKILPRVTTPPLTEAEANKVAPVDLLTLAGEIVGFLLPKATQEG
ncbi:hypothetical protein LMG33818_002614 [Halomonadaceae bacterium LMG 33818]|uniref:phage tail assembly protein n=1 Tax=Cernens ardua TaxID=3402176 RepID=UPI003EDBD23E